MVMTHAKVVADFKALYSPGEETARGRFHCRQAGVVGRGELWGQAGDQHDSLRGRAGDRRGAVWQATDSLRAS